MWIIPTLLGAVSAGLNASSDFQSARASAEVAEANYLLETGNARTRLSNDLASISISGARSRIALDSARINAQLSLADAEARERNAERLRGFAETRTAQGREAIRRARRNFEALEGRQKASIATAGVADSGSALDVMAESARQMATTLADMWDEASFERTETLDRARQEQFAAGQTRIGAQADLAMARRSARIDRAGRKIARIGARSQYRSALFGAEINLASGYDQSAGQRMAGYGSIFSGLASIGGMIHQQNRNTPI